ncbi:hypothetical protein PILCRDRAFT_827437 [Piloderma croceum F 1598]|uniref:Uncharacterized protein n=1 Tax=Piloderma croceum (strain F 1598) TaxID=765440 RepID=A0A0C3AMT5_PILCF|nr:hypothetical protein PILCRDRAFT_827437 [Piloderma croceum F 1598]
MACSESLLMQGPYPRDAVVLHQVKDVPVVLIWPVEVNSKNNQTKEGGSEMMEARNEIFNQGGVAGENGYTK